MSTFAFNANSQIVAHVHNSFVEFIDLSSVSVRPSMRRSSTVPAAFELTDVVSNSDCGADSCCSASQVSTAPSTPKSTCCDGHCKPCLINLTQPCVDPDCQYCHQCKPSKKTRTMRRVIRKRMAKVEENMA